MKRWRCFQQDPHANDMIEEGKYVKALGSIRHFDKLTYLSAIKVYELTDLNELTTHLLEVSYALVYYTKVRCFGVLGG